MEITIQNEVKETLSHPKVTYSGPKIRTPRYHAKQDHMVIPEQSLIFEMKPIYQAKHGNWGYTMDPAIALMPAERAAAPVFNSPVETYGQRVKDDNTKKEKLVIITYPHDEIYDKENTTIR